MTNFNELILSNLKKAQSDYKTEFSGYKKMRFHNIDKIANNIVKHFKRLKPFKF